jgi:hypothetical protein
MEMTAIYFRFHRWRGFPVYLDEQLDLLHVVIPLGFCTVFICKVCLIEARRKLRRTIADVLPGDDGEGR